MAANRLLAFLSAFGDNPRHHCSHDPVAILLTFSMILQSQPQPNCFFPASCNSQEEYLTVLLPICPYMCAPLPPIPSQTPPFCYPVVFCCGEQEVSEGPALYVTPTPSLPETPSPEPAPPGLTCTLILFWFYLRALSGVI